MKSNSLPSLFIFLNDYLKGREKLSIGPISKNTHLTFHFGTKSKCFDIHITHDGENKRYEPILKIKHSILYKLITNFNRKVLPIIYIRFFKNNINLGKLKKYDCYLQPLSLDNLELFFKISSNQNRFKLKKQIDVSALKDCFISAKNFDFKYKSYFVYRNKKGSLIKNGILYKKFNSNTNKSFIFIPQKKFRKMVRIIRNGFLKELKELDNNSYLAIKKIIDMF